MPARRQWSTTLLPLPPDKMHAHSVACRRRPPTSLATVSQATAAYYRMDHKFWDAMLVSAAAAAAGRRRPAPPPAPPPARSAAPGGTGRRCVAVRPALQCVCVQVRACNVQRPCRCIRTASRRSGAAGRCRLAKGGTSTTPTPPQAPPRPAPLSARVVTNRRLRPSPPKVQAVGRLTGSATRSSSLPARPSPHQE